MRAVPSNRRRIRAAAVALAAASLVQLAGANAVAAAGAGAPANAAGPARAPALHGPMRKRMAAVPSRPLAERDLRSLVTLLEPRIAPDGKRIALVVRRPDFDKNVYRNELVLVDARGGAPRTLVRERDDVGNARWSPCGDRIAFLATPAKEPDAKEEPSPQLYVLRLDGGEPARITDAEQGVESFAWRPDGRAFVYVARDASPDAKRIKAHDDWFEVTDDAWTARASRAPAHLWTIDADGKRAHRVTRGSWSVDDEPAFAPDGRSVFAVTTPAASTNHYRARALERITLANGARRTLVGGSRSVSGPLLAPDGRTLLYGAEHPQAFSQSELFATALDGSRPRDLSAALDRNVQFAAFVRDRVVVGANDGTRDRLFALPFAYAADANAHTTDASAHATDASTHAAEASTHAAEASTHTTRAAGRAGGAIRPLPLGDVDLAGDATASRDGTLAFVGVTPAHPAELYVLRDGAAAPQRLTRYNAAVAAHAMGRTRTVTWRSADGFAADGVLTEPASGMRNGVKYPLMVLIHGGPTATSLEGFSSLVQLMAARGWLVFQPNYRGSDNLGHRFAQATVPHITSAPARDVLDGVDAVQRMGIVDATHVFVSGWSEGGLMTSWLIGHDHRWRAAMSGAAVNDWTQYADMTDAKDFTPSFIGASPWASEKWRALYDAESPLTYAADVKTPTLIMTDAGDYRVPTPLSYEFYHAIRATGTPVEMVVFPVNGHNPSDPLHREDRTHRWIDWFVRHL